MQERGGVPESPAARNRELCVNPVLQSLRACLFLPYRLRGLKMKERVRPRPQPGFPGGTLGFFQLGFDNSSALRALKAEGGGCDVLQGNTGLRGPRQRYSARAHARCATAERARLAAAAAAHRRDQTLRLRSGGAGREEGRRWRRHQRRLLKRRRRRRGSGGRCFCQFRLFVREVDPPLPEQPGGSCGSRGQHRPRPSARASPSRHGQGLRPPLQAAHHRRQR